MGLVDEHKAWESVAIDLCREFHGIAQIVDIEIVIVCGGRNSWPDSGFGGRDLWVDGVR
jgi:hypothetical protein